MPQKAIPIVMSDEKYLPYLKEKNRQIGERSKIISNILQDIPFITFNETFGAFYNTIVFKEDVLKEKQFLQIDDERQQALLDSWLTDDIAFDKRFVYYLLAAKGVCVVPLSSFHSELKGFRVTLLEENEKLLIEIFSKIKDALMEYCESHVVLQ